MTIRAIVCFKVMLRDFSQQRCNAGTMLQNNVAAMLQPCVALKIVVANRPCNFTLNFPKPWS